MLFGRQEIEVEQPDSLARELRAHGIKHGDVVKDVEFEGVGYRRSRLFIFSRLVLAFCPARIVKMKEVVAAAREERAKPFPYFAAWTPDAKSILGKTSFPPCGFTRIVCDITSNGSIHLSNVRVIDIEEAHPATIVNQHGTYEYFKATQA